MVSFFARDISHLAAILRLNNSGILQIFKNLKHSFSPTHANIPEYAGKTD